MSELVDVEEGGEDVAPGEPGEIVIRSPLIMKEYWNNPEETAGQMKGRMVVIPVISR